MPLDIVITGDSIINREVSFCTDSRFRSLVDRIRGASVSFTHLETVCHDFHGREVYPAAVSGGTWTRAPTTIGRELSWTGFDLVSHASNHALDFSYGGLRETWGALRDAGIEYAGTGENLAAAREPAFVGTEEARVGVVSMTTSFPEWSRAGDARPDMRGRPGVNPLRHHYEVDDDSFATLHELGRKLGFVVMESSDELKLMSPESRNAISRFERSSDGKIRRVLHPRDREGNLRSIEHATKSADVVIAHVHSHEFRLDGDVSRPPEVMESFSRECIDHGADIVVNQGSHAPTRGIEIHEGSPIFYDPGEFFLMSSTITRQPSDFYYGIEEQLSVNPFEATPAEGLAARGFGLPWEGEGFSEEDSMASPEGGFFVGPGSVLARCRFDESLTVSEVVLDPVTWTSTPKSRTGIPVVAEAELAAEIIEHVVALSEPYGTSIEREESVGKLEI